MTRIRRQPYLLVLGVFLALSHPALTGSVSWSSWFSTSNGNSNGAAATADNAEADAASAWNVDLVSPIVNRELATSVVAHNWPTTPHSMFCEGYAYLSMHPEQARSYIDALLRQINVMIEEDDSHTTNVSSSSLSSSLLSYAQARQRAQQALPWGNNGNHNGDDGGASARLAHLALDLRSFSPTCELHRGLARQTLLQQQQQQASYYDDDNRNNTNDQNVVNFDDDAFVVLYKNSPLVGRVWRLEELALLENWVGYAGAKGDDVNHLSETDQQSLLLPDEVLYPATTTITTTNSTTTLLFGILYANLGTTVFGQMYQLLTEHNVTFVIRHLGDVRWDERSTRKPSKSSSSSSSKPTVLQGYGVRLDIRNIEYKVFDDRDNNRKGNADGENDLWLNLTNVRPRPPVQFLAGVNLTALGLDDKDYGDGKDDLIRQLWQRHEQQHSTAQLVPPVWQRRQLPLQAATVLAHAHDVLVTLQDLSQNLPSVASTLVHVPVNEDVHVLAQAMEHDRRFLQPGRLYVNGRLLAWMDRPSFNVFELLDSIRKEQEAVEDMYRMLGPYLSANQLRRVQQAWMGKRFGKDKDDDDDDINNDEDASSDDDVFRIDVARNGKQAILYLNDVEKDAQYRQWPSSLQQMMMQMQYGMPPMVRRNLFTMLVVIDPLAPLGAANHVGWQASLQLMQNSLPVRTGILLVSAADVEECAAWVARTGADEGVACPVPPLFPAQQPSLKDLEKTVATTQALHLLVSSFARNFDSQPGALVAYAEYLMSSIAEHQETQGDFFYSDLINLHGTLLEGMQISSVADAKKQVLEILIRGADDDSVEDILYSVTLRFVVDKNIAAGMSFLNGRPLPTSLSESSSAEVSSLIQKEQQYIFGLIAKGDITDSSPRSVYGKVLTGARVFKRAHPLLLDAAKKSDVYLSMDHAFGAASLLVPKNQPLDGPNFLVELVVDFQSNATMKHISNLILALESFPTTHKRSGGPRIGFRIIPGTEASARTSLCSIFAHAANLGISAVLGAMETRQEQASSLQEILIHKLHQSDDGLSDAAWVPCSSAPYGETENMVVVNGRRYVFGDIPITVTDVELLLEMELGRAKVVKEILADRESDEKFENVLEASGRVAAYLALGDAGTSPPRVDLLHHIALIEREIGLNTTNPLVWQWNVDKVLSAGVVAVVDPVTNACQRFAPLFRVFRDELKLPFTLILAPASLIDGDTKIPLSSYYRFVAETNLEEPRAVFDGLPTNHVLTLRMDVPEPWDVQQTSAIQDTDNLMCSATTGCGDAASSAEGLQEMLPVHEQRHLTEVEYGLNSLLIFGQCYEVTGTPPNGLQLVLAKQNVKLEDFRGKQQFTVNAEGSIYQSLTGNDERVPARQSDTLVMKNVGYWQLQASPGMWTLSIAEESRGADIFDFVNGTVQGGRITEKSANDAVAISKSIAVKDFTNRGELLLTKRRQGHEKATLFFDDPLTEGRNETDTINVFSLATGHLYERFLKIMMLSVTKRTSAKVKFWLFENYLSPTFKASATAMADKIGCEVAFVTYKWPEWLRGQTEKQRIIWGYKILFLDVLFPLDVKRIIYVDADQVVRGDLKELWDLDLKGAPYGYTPFCTSRESTLGYQFWREGFWHNHLRGKPYHISALYVVDLETFRRNLVGDQLRTVYQQLSADPNSLSNLDQDLPNYAQHQVPIFSLPQDWLWCESWCSDETKATAKTIDLCNNPEHKEPKVSMAKRVISGPLFNESWVELDAEVEQYYQEYLRETNVAG